MKRFKATAAKFPSNGELIAFCEFCQICESGSDEISEMVNYGLLEPKGHSLNNWHFTTDDIIRVRRARRLQQDLNLNLPGVTFALELLDEIKLLRGQLLYLERLSRVY